MRTESSFKFKKDCIAAVGLEMVFTDDVLGDISIHIFETGEYLCHAGDSIEFFQVIIKGKCKVIPSSESGKEVLLSYLEPVSFNGDIELFNQCEALHSVKAANEVVAIAVPQKVFFGEMMNRPLFLQMLCKSLAIKIHSSSQNNASTMLYPVKNRLGRLLLKEATEQKSSIVHIKISEVAQQLGVSPRHIRRVLSGYEEKKVIKRSGNKIVLLDLKALQLESSYF